MEPLTMAMTFATIASLMASYKSENRTNKSEDDYPNFIGWLEENNKDDILELLNNNFELSQSIKEAIILCDLNKCA